MIIKRIVSILFLFLLCFALLTLGACNYEPAPDESASDEPGQTDAQKSAQNGIDSRELTDEEKFDILIDELYRDWVTEDTITLNYSLADPEAMGIKHPEPTYGEVMTPELFEKERVETENLAKSIAEIDSGKLSGERRIIYDIIDRSIELSKILEEKEDFTYYTGYVRPLTGLQAQIPTLLAEFKFYKAEDIDLYLALLEDTIRYFDDIIAFERERAARGFFLSDTNLDTVIEQLESFLEHREDNFLITIVNDKIDGFTELPAQQREELKQRNRELVLSNVLVAYDNMLEAMRSLKGVGAHPGGLAELPDGLRFAHAALSARAGTDMSVNELITTMDRWRAKTLQNVRNILFEDDRFTGNYLDNEAGRIPGGTAQEYLLVLQNEMLRDFPPIEAVDYKILEVHESMREFLSPAFFIVPPADRYDDNVMYINPAKIGNDSGDNLYFFTTLAHEGYPGHMYQMVYFRQSSPHPLRLLLSNIGYSEGWATYAEYLSYDYAGLDALEAKLMREMNLYYLLLHANIDIGVNVLGWDETNVAELFYEDLGVTDPAAASWYYNSVTGVPLNPCMYALGYIEFSMLREEVENALGDEFNLLDFHERLLRLGPAPFSIIREHADFS